MSASLQLLPWLGGTLNNAQLRLWLISAERMGAGIVVGIDYPSPANVAALCETLLNCVDAFDMVARQEGHAVTCEDAGELHDAILAIGQACEDIAQESNQAEDDRREAVEKWEQQEERAIQAEKERDALQAQLDSSEAHAASLLRQMQASERKLAAIRVALEWEEVKP